jgi:uridine kinase
MIISIAGGTGAGKSTIAKEISKHYRQTYNLNSVVVSMDNYYKNIHLEKFENYDHPDAFNTTLLYDDLLHYIQTKSINIRKYDYESKESRYLETVSDVDLLVLEGLYAFYPPKINALCNLT